MQGQQDVAQQIQELTVQNSMLMAELYEVKKALEDGKNKQSGGQGGNNQQNGGSQQGGNSQQGGSSQQGLQPVQLANDLQLLKNMVQNLEAKMTSYVSQQAKGGQLTQEDVVNLLLTMMSGMMDWATDLVNKQVGGQGAGGGKGGFGKAGSGQGGAQAGGGEQLQ